MTSAAPEVAEPSHLLHLLEKQPSCLLRIGREGTLLACNDAGLSLLGHHDLAGVLNRPFEEHLCRDHVAGWREFLNRVDASGAGSFECELTPGEAGRRNILLQAVALRNHPDKIDSMLVAVRDTTPIRRLEASLREEQRQRQRLSEISNRLESTSGDQQQLAAQLQEGRDERERLAAALRERETERDRAIEARRQAEALLEIERATAEKLTDAEGRLGEALEAQRQALGQLEASRVEQHRLAVTMQERERERAVLVDEHRVERDRLQQLAEQHQLAVLQQERASRERVGALEMQLAGAVSEHERLTRLIEEIRTSGSAAQAAVTEREQHIAAIERQLADAIVDLARIPGLEQELAEATADLAKIPILEQELAEATAELAKIPVLERQLADATVDLAKIPVLEEELAAATAALAKIPALERELADARAELGKVAILERQRVELEAERDRAMTRAETQSAAEARLQAALAETQHAVAVERDRHRADIESLQAERSAAGADRDRAVARVGELEATLRQAAADHAAEREQMERALAAGRDEARTSTEAALQRALDETRAAAAEQLARDHHAIEELTRDRHEARAERDRATGLVEKLAAELRQVAGEHDAVRAQLERALDDAKRDAAAEHEADRRAVADAELRHALAVAEQKRLLEFVEQGASDRRRAAADRAASRAEIERELVSEHERAMAARDRDRAELVANLQAELALALADQKRLQMLLGRAEADQERLRAMHAAERSDIERTLGEATIKKNEIFKRLSDQRVELQQWQQTARALEPLATAGRLAGQLSRELHELVMNLDERAKLLLGVSRLDAGHRPVVEALRADAMRAASLARQLSRSAPDLPDGEELH